VPVSDDEPLGGDPPCWAHLFDDDADAPGAGGGQTGDGRGLSTAERAVGDAEHPVDLAACVRAATASGAVWTHQSEDLNANLLVFASGEGVAEHVNTEVDVLVIGIAGEGVVAVDGTRRVLRAGYAIVIPKGARRGIQGVREPFAYLTCHRRRAGLWPAQRDS
jgi:quercetin dioxygenase-like cupin family protein